MPDRARAEQRGWTHVEIDVPIRDDGDDDKAVLDILRSVCERHGLTMSSNYEDLTT